MKYLAIWKTSEEKTSTPPTPEMEQRMGKLIEAQMKAGNLVSTGGISNPKKSVRVKRAGAKVTITDGPFIESKELVAGFAILEATSREHAIEQIKEFLEVAGDGTSEVHELWGDPISAPPR
jgi:hypothetical protein